MLRPMVDPVRPPEPLPDVDAAADSAQAPPIVPAQAFTLPTARKVVSSGLQLALSSTGELRRASIYIGLLVLGAFGPAIIALLLIIGRLGEQAGDSLANVFFGEAFGAPPQPALEAALLVVAVEALVGAALFFTISIDAQVMAIAILGGRATERPLRLWESIIRARQTFWRMAGAGTLVGLVAFFVQLLILGAVGGLSQSAETASILGSLIATIVIAPLAYVATSIVIGDVGAMEALSRSWRLFRVRRMLAVVVVLFTFVTSAIQLFALESGLDLVIRASELLHVSLTEGALAFATAVVLILAAIVAYGSLTFTIGAIVSAPQVSGFLGLTHFSGGIDRARVDAARPPRGFRYVSRPMTVAMIALTGIVGIQIPAINAIPPPPTSALLELIREEAAVESDRIEVSGYPTIVDDPAGDLPIGAPADIDIVRAEATLLDSVPAWILDEFTCGEREVACGTDADDSDPFGEGAYLFFARAGSQLVPDARHRFTILLALENEVGAFRRGGAESYGGASRIFVTQPGDPATLEASRSQGDRFTPWQTAGRSTWAGTDFFVLIPLAEVASFPLGWDVVALIDDGSGAITSRDSLRSDWEAPLPEWHFPSTFIDDFRSPG